MRMVSKWVLFKGVIALAAVLLISGLASAQTTTVTDVQSPADFQNGNTEVSIVASVDCVTIGDIVSFEAVQNQGRHHAVAVLDVECTSVGLTTATYVLPAFDGLRFRSGPFTLLVRIFDSAGVSIGRQGFYRRGQ